LIGAARAGCLSMAVSMLFEQAGHPPKQIRTRAEVELDKVDAGFKITCVERQPESDLPCMNAGSLISLEAPRPTENRS
jgi:organic hydroperoxide reductase OsmC/OhrA